MKFWYDERFYAFLRDSYFEPKTFGSKRYDVEALAKMSPHDIYRLQKGDLSKTIRGVGQKSEAVIFQLIDKYKPEGMFCPCGEPLLKFYRFCPVCGNDFAQKGYEDRRELTED